MLKTAMVSKKSSPMYGLDPGIALASAGFQNVSAMSPITKTSLNTTPGLCSLHHDSPASGKGLSSLDLSHARALFYRVHLAGLDCFHVLEQIGVLG